MRNSSGTVGLASMHLKGDAAIVSQMHLPASTRETRKLAFKCAALKMTFVPIGACLLSRAKSTEHARCVYAQPPTCMMEVEMS